MMRMIIGVILGYVAMAAFVFITFSVTYMILETEGSFQPNSYEVSVSWIFASIVLGLAGAILGGLTSVSIGRSKGAPKILAGLVLVLGIAMAIPTFSTVDRQPLVRSGEVALMEAMQSAHQPSWLVFINPLIGAAGVLVGSRLRKDRTKR